MSNRSYCGPNRFSQNYRSNNSNNEHDRYKLPAINNGTAIVPNMNLPSVTRPCLSQGNNNYPTQFSNSNNIDYNTSNTNNPSLSANCAPYGPAAYNARIPSYNNCKIYSPTRGVASSQTFSSLPPTSGMYNVMQQAPANRSWSSNQFVGFDKTNTTNTNVNKNPLINQNNNSPPRPMTSIPGGFNCSSSNMNTSNGQKTVVRDRYLANEILQKAGISNLKPNDCLEVITDTPVTINDNVNCDSNPLCMKKLADSQECYEQSIVVRHLQPPRSSVPPPPIIIREHCAQPLPPQSPIVIRQIPPRPSTPPPLIIRECPPLMPDMQEPTIIEREVPPPPPPPRQVIVERLPTPTPKPRSIIFEKWLPYEEPENRPCIVEKAVIDEKPLLKNVIIQYEALEPRIQPQCINEGISYVDPKQFVNERPNGNVEVCYVDQLNNLPDHIKCQLSPQVLAAIGIQNDNKQNTNNNPYVVRTNPPDVYQQHGRIPSTSTPPMSHRHSMMTNGCHPAKSSYSQLGNPNVYGQQQQPGNRARSASAVGLPPCYDKYNANMLSRPGNQGSNNLARAHYNPWATTYQVSYTNKGRGMCRAR